MLSGFPGALTVRPTIGEKYDKTVYEKCNTQQRYETTEPFPEITIPHEHYTHEGRKRCRCVLGSPG